MGGTPAQARRAAIYPRVSTGGQEQEGTSLGTQEQRCRQYAGERGYAVAEEHVYRDVHTGTELWERPQLTRLRDAVRQRDIDVVVVYALDRLSRNQNHIGVLVDEFERYGVPLELVTEDFENSVVGKFIRSAKAFASELEVEKIRERTIRGKRARLQAGKILPGWKSLYGYRWRDETHSSYEIDPATAWVVQRIFRESAEGRGLVRIAQGLTDDGIARPSDRDGPRWGFSTVGHILQETAYIGQKKAWRRNTKTKGKGKRWHTDAEQIGLPSDALPAIVDPTLFATVRQRMAVNRELVARNNHTPDASLLRGGFARCGLCGDALHVMPVQGRNGQKAYQYQRAGHYKGECRYHSIMAHILDDVVWQHIEGLLNDPSMIEKQLARLSAHDPTSADLEALDRRLENVGRQQANLVDQLASVSGTVAALILEKLNGLETQRQQLVTERASIERRHGVWLVARDRAWQVQEWCRTVAERVKTLTYDEKRLTLEALGIEVKVWPVGSENRWVLTASVPLSAETLQIASSRSRVAPRSITWTRDGTTACARRSATATLTIAGR